jgi:hypothetical protein
VEQRCTLEEVTMIIDLLLALAWVVIVFLPVYAAFRQPIVSIDGYLDLSRGDAPHSEGPATTAQES